MGAIEEWIRVGIRTLAAWVTKFIYEMIAWTYELLIEVSQVRLLNNTCIIMGKDAGKIFTTQKMCESYGGVWQSSPITLIYQRITLLLGIVMAFYISFRFIKYLLEPDEITDKEKGIEKMGFKLLTVVALLALVPNLFNIAYDLQDAILKSQFLPKIILGIESTDQKNFGRYFAGSFLSTFYYTEPGYEETAKCEHETEFCTLYAGYKNKCDSGLCNMGDEKNGATINQLLKDGDLKLIKYGLGDYSPDKTFYIHFDVILCVLSGAAVLWMLIMYTLDVGARVVHLLFLQIIAPIPIIAYLSPQKDGTFQKWTKSCFATYLDVFIRLSILYLTMLIIEAITKAYNTPGMLIRTNDSDLKMYVYIVLIIGTMRFCQKVPKLVESLFPKMESAVGSFGLKPGERIPTAARRIAGAAIAGGAGAAVGLLSGAAQGFRARKALDKDGNERGWKGALGGVLQGATRGVTGGAVRGIASGAKKGNVFKNTAAGIKKQTKADKNFGNRVESGYTLGGQIHDKVGGFFGASRIETAEKAKRPKEAVIKERDAEKSYRKAVSDKAFENAVTKGKGKDDINVRAAVENYNKKEQEEKDLMSTDSATRALYRKGQIKQDSASIARYDAAKKLRDSELAKANSQAYYDAVKSRIPKDGARLGISKFDYVKETQEFDQKAWEEEKQKNPNKFMKESGIVGSDGRPIMVPDDEAWEKEKEKYTKTKREIDTEAYNQAVEEARNARVEEERQKHIKAVEEYYNKEISQCVYASDAEAEDARVRRLDDVRREKKDAKDRVSFAYEDWGTRVDETTGEFNDKEIGDMSHAREEEHDIYNRYSSSENQINREDEIYETAKAVLAEKISKETGREVDASSITNEMVNEEFARTDADKRITRAEVEDKWIKSTVTRARREAQDFVREREAEIQNYRQQIDGSNGKK